MSTRWRGTRVAPAALAIVSGLVVVGFLQVDRQMVRAERSHAALMVSEAAGGLEVFLLRHVARMSEIAGQLRASPDMDSAGIREVIATSGGDWAVRFDTLWIVDSSGILTAVPTRNGPGVEHLSVSREVGTSHWVWRRFLQPQGVVGVGRPSVGFVRVNGTGVLVFGQTLSRDRRAMIVGSVTADRLAAALRQRVRSDGTFGGLQVVYGGDTVVSVRGPTVARHSRSVEAGVEIPAAKVWNVTLAYAPAGRGIRIALWIVGLGSLMGLAIGLVLERRESTRIADRSSELEHLSAELLRANRAKSEFLANVSHELRTPLNAIVGFVDLLRDGVYGALNPRQVGPVERIEASANHLRHLVDQVLDLAKIAAGRLEVHTEPVELRPFVFDVASEVEPLITTKGLTFSLSVAASLPRVRTDPTHLRQILINLLGNAVKFTDQGGISVRAKAFNGRPEASTRAATLRDGFPPSPPVRSGQPWIALQVADSGIGIPEKDRDRIFDEFEQVNAGPRGDSMKRGTGLGLSISRRLARLLGGEISVDSQVGRGSVFTVWLPVDPADLHGGHAV